jgi:hypothetical protein
MGMLATTSCSTSNPLSAQETVPTQALQAGYVIRTYGPSPTLETSKANYPGVAFFYPPSFLGQSEPASASQQNADGTITLPGRAGDTTNGQVASATSARNMAGFVGIAFGGGGYFEATLKFDGWQGAATDPNSTSMGWPSFWSLSLEHLLGSDADQWPGQVSGYQHFGEIDFLEYNLASAQKTDEVYSGSIHDFYGLPNVTCAPAMYCEVQNTYASKILNVPANTDFSAYHNYGMIWVPATDSGDGYVQWYFDDEPIGQPVTWAQFSQQSPNLTSVDMDFGIIDLQHFVVILGTGVRYPMTVSAVSVWQKSSASNLVSP